MLCLPVPQWQENSHDFHLFVLKSHPCRCLCVTIMTLGIVCVLIGRRLNENGCIKSCDDLY